MAVRGSVAKENVIKKIATAFGDDAIGEYDRKYYVWANDGGERVQIALTLTCPKTFIDAPSAAATAPNENLGDWDFEDEAPKSVAATKAEPAVITEQETENIANLLKKLGL